jgi:type I restriction enzyme S subunit
MSFPKYESYKDSGVEWLGEVPEHWEITKTKYVTKFHTGWTPPTGKNESYEGENLWASISDLGEKWLSDTAKHISDEAIASSRITPSPKGSLLFSFKLSANHLKRDKIRARLPYFSIMS